MFDINNELKKMIAKYPDLWENKKMRKNSFF